MTTVTNIMKGNSIMIFGPVEPLMFPESHVSFSDSHARAATPGQDQIHSFTQPDIMYAHRC